MSAGQKPDISIYIKPAGSKEKTDRRYILSGWASDGRISSLRFDRGVAAIAVKFDDGEQVVIRKGPDGKVTSHYIDCFLRDGEYGTPTKNGDYNRKDPAFGGGSFEAPAEQEDFGFDVG